MNRLSETWTRFLVWLGEDSGPRAWRFFLQWRTRYVLAWLLVLGTAGNCLYQAWISYGNEARRDGNAGHTFIDFGGQWLMGRLLVSGNGPLLYHRDVQRELILAAYPEENEPPQPAEPSQRQPHDHEELMRCLMGTGDGIGGPLYPPVNAFVYAPLGLFKPQVGYRIMQVFGTLLAFGAGLGVSYLTRGRLWCPIAAAFLMIYPGFSPSLKLGQNAALTVTILIWGWALIARGRPVAGGLVWGLFAFKPVWALAFFLVPLVTGRWRVCLAMIAAGVGFAAATLPWVGVQAWLDWLEVGRIAAKLYDVDQNWICLSRDLLSMPRRWLINFDDPDEDRRRLQLALIGWTLIGVAFVLTVGLALRRRAQARQVLGACPAFLFLGAWMCCYHFMYYDVLLTALPFFLLIHDPWQFLQRQYVLLTPCRRPAPGRRWLGWLRRRVVPLSPQRLGIGLAKYLQAWLPSSYPGGVPLLRGRPAIWVFNQAPLYFLVMLWLTEHAFPGWGLGPGTAKYWHEPWDTYCLILLWIWCGGRWLRSDPGAIQLPAPSEWAKRKDAALAEITPAPAASPEPSA